MSSLRECLLQVSAEGYQDVAYPANESGQIHKTPIYQAVEQSNHYRDDLDDFMIARDPRGVAIGIYGVFRGNSPVIPVYDLPDGPGPSPGIIRGTISGRPFKGIITGPGHVDEIKIDVQIVATRSRWERLRDRWISLP